MKRKLLSLLLAVAMTFSLAITAGAEETDGAAMDGQIVILHTNDVHGAITGYAKVAALKDAYEAQGAYVLLMDAGDFIQGDPTVSVSEGATAVELMNMAGYDVVTLGNHEFDYGYENMKTLAEAAEFPIVAANVLYNAAVSVAGNVTAMEKAAFDTHTIFTAPDGTKIGVFGLDTPETATKAHPAKIQGVTFLAGEELFDCAQAEVQLLEDAHCDYIVCLGHLGIGDESTGNRSIDLLQEVDGIDVFIDGHSENTLAEYQTAGYDRVGDTVVTSTGSKMENVGVITIAADGTIRTGNVPLADLTEEDPTVAARAAAIQKEIDDDYGTVFARTEVALNGERAPGNRTGETNLGDLICDALVWGARKNGETVDAAVTNGGGIRASIAAGDVTKKDINTVLPFGNTLSIVKITGAELLEALEASTYCTPDEIGGFPQVSGIVFIVDTTRAYDQGEQYPGSTYYGPKSIRRVTIESVGGRAFDPEATYTIATNDFMAAGGDTYYAFAAASVNYDLGIPMDEVVMDYITEELDGVVAAADYGEPAGRITVKTPVSELPFTDVAATADYYEDVKYCYDNNIFKGTTDTTFEPDTTMNRGQMVTVLWRLNGSPEPTSANPFTDVADTSAYARAITWAAENKLTNGTTDTTFAPNQTITRQQFLAILYRYARFMEYDVSVGEDTNILSYEDVNQAAEYAIPALQWACGTGVLEAEGKLEPTAAAPRWQVAEFLANFSQLVVPTETTAEQAA